MAAHPCQAVPGAQERQEKEEDVELEDVGHHAEDGEVFEVGSRFVCQDFWRCTLVVAGSTLPFWAPSSLFTSPQRAGDPGFMSADEAQPLLLPPHDAARSLA